MLLLDSTWSQVMPQIPAVPGGLTAGVPRADEHPCLLIGHCCYLGVVWAQEFRGETKVLSSNVDKGWVGFGFVPWLLWFV